MRRFRRSALAVPTAAALLAVACASAPPAASPVASSRAVPVDSVLALLTFDSAWSRIATTHYDTAYGGVDWPGVRAELRPGAAAAGTLGGLRDVLDDMLGRLGESHFVVIPREAADALAGDDRGAGPVSGDAGLLVRLVGDDMAVWRVDAGGPAGAAGIEPGWVVVAAGGREFAPRIAALRALPDADQRTALTRLLYQANGQLAGEAGKVVRLRLRDADGAEVERDVVLRETPGEVVRFGNLPPVIASLRHDRIPTATGCAGLIRLNVWVVPLVPSFDRAVDAVRDCHGVVIDLRGNPGGVAGMVMGTAGHFLEDTLALGFMRTRTAELRFKANPRRVRADGSPVRPYDGPLAILVDEMTASTSEFFAAGLQAVGRSRVFGTASAGQALPALMVRLPTGDVLMHVIADFTGPGGVRIEGRGVLPDVPVRSTLDDLRSGRDAPLQAALDWFAGTGGTGNTHTGGSTHD
ncbi:MAG TPA: S41 family peptidase [Longimicrobiales bacterium]|nr:S41 family peptidase [Longimicrobiales bacterium]